LPPASTVPSRLPAPSNRKVSAAVPPTRFRMPLKPLRRD